MAFQFRIITDARVKDIYVGDESYSKKAKKKRDDEDSFNSLRDLLEDPDLVIIRLGFLGYSNKAMPGALKEACLTREALKKATWLVEDPEIAPFSQGHHAWSPEVEVYVHRTFAEIDLEGEAVRPSPKPSLEKAPSFVGGPSLDPEEDMAAPREEPVAQGIRELGGENRFKKSSKKSGGLAGIMG